MIRFRNILDKNTKIISVLIVCSKIKSHPKNIVYPKSKPCSLSFFRLFARRIMTVSAQPSRTYFAMVNRH